MSGSFDQLIAQLAAWNGRRRLHNALIWLPRGLLVGLLLALIIATAARFRPLLTNQEIAYVSLALAAVCLLIAAIALLWQRSSLLQQARFADHQFRLKERATTAVEIQTGQLPTHPTLAKQQLRDTLTAVSQVDTAALMPLQLNRQEWLLALLAILLLATAVYLPNSHETTLINQRNIEKTIAEQEEALELLSQEIQQNPDLTDAQKEALSAPVEQALQALQQDDLNQEQTMAVLSEAEAELRSLASQNNQQQLQQQLQQAGQPLSNNAASQSLGDALQNGNLGQASAAANQLADNLPQLTRDEQLALAQSLMETAQALAGTDNQLAQQFAQAAQALQNGDVAAAQQTLRQASATLQQRAQEAATAQQANQTANAINDGRQAVGQAGNPDNVLSQNDGRATENGTMGQQQQPGQGQGQGQGQGEGQGQGQGEGQGQGQGQGQGDSNSSGSGIGGPSPGGGHAESLFVPEFQDLSGLAGTDIELTAECRTNPANCGLLINENSTDFRDENSRVPYTQVFGNYQNAANEALQDDYIPLGLKGYIRDYFSSLQP